MRGKVRAQCVQRDCVGITPAYAGKRDLFPAGKTAPRDHPRMCGEKRPLARWAILPPGSPPRMRGKGYDVVSRLCRVRITPACAGKRDKTGWTTTCPRDHPRMCGEKLEPGAGRLWPGGSPPRMRGKVTLQDVPCDSVGITPAYAGKSFLVNLAAQPRGDHPRMCGEKALVRVSMCTHVGSPPHVRGKD